MEKYAREAKTKRMKQKTLRESGGFSIEPDFKIFPRTGYTRLVFQDSFFTGIGKNGISYSLDIPKITFAIEIS